MILNPYKVYCALGLENTNDAVSYMMITNLLEALRALRIIQGVLL